MTTTSSMRHERVPQNRIAETVAATLRARILSSKSDYRLPTQDQLVEEFGVSYPSLREALRILETEGLVTVRRGKVGGADAHRPDETSAAYHLGLVLQGGRVTLGDLATGLETLEPLCTAAVAGRADRAEVVLPALRENIERSAELIGDGAAFTRTAREFHDLIVAFTPNATTRYVISSLVALWTAQEQSWAENRARIGKYPSAAAAKNALKAHRRIVEEIEAGNVGPAQELARAHLVATQAVVLDRFDADVVDVSAAGARRLIRTGGQPNTRI
jgi:GntR family transcriptional regulator, transcriptional repressor for pyruvate dehydrogenase complex